jgi:eukaryotic-like serine/threonine-protein kinase
MDAWPTWRGAAAQLAFELCHRDQIKLTKRSERLERDPLRTVLRRRFNKDLAKSIRRPAVAAQISSAPIVAVAVDLAEGSSELNDALRVTTQAILATLPAARLTCLNVLRLGRIAIDTTLDEEGHNKRIDRLVALRHWAEPLKLEPHRFSAHILEAVDPANAILEFARANHIDHIIIGARKDSLLRDLLGSVSAEVAAEAPCTVTVVRAARPASGGE